MNVFSIVEILVYLFVFIVGTLFLFIIVTYIIDRTQKKSTLRRNYPVLARFRYFFEHLGEFFRQYFFALDREEMPFNRAERSWIYRASKNINMTVAFGSTKNLLRSGTIYFVNAAFPPLKSELDKKEIVPVTIGPYCPKPYHTDSYFNVSGMSYGAISKPAIQALSSGAKKENIWLNTGEGGLSPYHLEGGADIVFQIGTAKFGVRDVDGNLDHQKLKEIAGHETVKMFEIKLAQGAKPGKGGILPAKKITPEIAKIRGIQMGEDAISPNRHLDIHNISDLLDQINHIRDITQKPVGFKSVFGAEDFFEDLCLEINKRGVESAPDFITIDSADGGTGAAPMSLIDNMGTPIQEALPKVINILKKHNLKERIKICASGKLVNPSEVAWAFCIGADFVVSARGFMFALGCIQALQCNKNTCPTGITTHDASLQYGLDPNNKAQRVAHYANNMTKELFTIAHSCGVHDPRALKETHIRKVP